MGRLARFSMSPAMLRLCRIVKCGCTPIVLLARRSYDSTVRGHSNLIIVAATENIVDKEKQVRFPKLYFGLADLQMTPFVSQNRFREAVLTNILFYGILVIPDAFWFMSEHLRKEILLATDENWILAGLRAGLILPWFRRKVEGSFQEAHEVIREQDIVGLVEDSDVIAKMLDQHIKESSTYRFGHWPKRLVGKGFYEQVLESLCKNDPPVPGPNVGRIWKQTATWRQDCVEEALDRTTDGTLRRGELLDVVGRKIGWSSREKVRNAAVLLQAAPREERRLLRYYLHWVNQCYQINQANAFRLECSLPSGSSYEQLGAFALFPGGDEPRSYETLSVTISIPRIGNILRRMHPSNIFEARLSEEGKHYFRCYTKWREEPSEAHANEVLDALSAYAERMRREYLVPSGEEVDFLEVWFGIKKEAMMRRYFIASAVDLAKNVPGYIPCIGTVVNWAAFLFRRSWGIYKMTHPKKVQILNEWMLGARRRHTVKLTSVHLTRARGQITQDLQEEK